ncbi:MAG: S8 family serine peptidase [Bacteroidaceae bacterium]|nr:S8 family serine peptidase [Bacteroidaceae bacterium]
MKTFRMLLSALCLAVSVPLVAQNVNHVHDVTTIDRHAARAYREGEVIVKFKPSSRVNVSAARTGAVRSSVGSVDAVFAKIGVTGAEQLMPLSGTGGPARVKSHSGSYIERTDMSKLYRLQLNAENGVAVHEAVEALKELADVEYAEPNYLVYSTVLPDNDKSEYEDEPLFKEQWAFNAINLKNVWTKEIITDKRPVIAILDTGVDITHPDLDDNIWTNEREADGAEDSDDDANGYKDDLHGWDFVNQTARIGDWNGHGTHVAGIAAAEGKNGQGITGANPDALIMPVTVMQSDGVGDVATIIKGIDYAAANGADVINMSFGGYAYSIAEEQALARAYSKAVLVAAAGNDCMVINHAKCPVCKERGAPMFPAAFTFVLGVEAGNRDGSRASFSNWDDDGPTFSKFSEEQLYNYELRAPGVAMTSTFPGGKYKPLNGTSMASPLVAGAISRLLQCKDYESKELLFGDLIHARKKSSNQMVDFQAAYEITDADRKPTLQFVTYDIFDGDSVDAGEGGGLDIPDIPNYLPKVSNDSVEYWYNIIYEYNNRYYKLLAEEEGDLTADTDTLGEVQQWKFIGNESDGYTITNKLGYTIYFKETGSGDFFVSKEPEEDTNFVLSQDGYTRSFSLNKYVNGARECLCASASRGNKIISFYGSSYNSPYIRLTPLFDEEESGSAEQPGTSTDVVTGDGDGIPDSGEVVELWPTLRNEWGNAENITFSLEVGEAEDPEIVEILDNNVSFGKPLSSYAKAKSEKPIRFKINENCVDGRHIRLVLRATCDNIAEELVQEFVITAENGVEIGGVIMRDLTLYPNKHYIVTKNLAIPEGVTLTIKPGTVLKFRPGIGITNDGDLVCKGTPDSLIVFQAERDGGSLRFGKSGKYADLEYVRITGFRGSCAVCANISNSIMEYNGSSLYPIQYIVDECNIYNSNIVYNFISYAIIHYSNCNVFNTNVVENLNRYDPPFVWNNVISSNVFSNYNFDNATPRNLEYESSSVSVLNFDKPSYWGSANEETVRLGVYDMYHKTKPVGSGVVNLSNMLTRPNAEAHGIVWKVVVNGCDAQDEFDMLPPLGVGKHKFEVYFNRPMDVSVAPNIAMGVRPPYTQVVIGEEGEWSADSLVYTAYLTIDGKTSSDGLNRIYVDGAKDTDHFEIPIEKRRFNVEVAAAGSMATGLMAEAGLGKVTLTWETDEEDFEDLLGYNIYRYTEKLDSTYTNYDKNGNWVGGHWEVKGDTTIINERVLESDVVEFTDFDVVPGTTYYYVIKQITTSLNSHALSNPVAVTPLTAEKGDANGSMNVDIADVVTEVAWLTNQNPQPFIFEAADVNSDSDVNILDVVGTVTIITNPQGAATASVNSTATYTIEDGVLYIDSDVAIGGIQLSIEAAKGTEFASLIKENGFEQMATWLSDNEYQFLVFSMSGKSLAPGKHAVLRIGDAALNEVILSNSRGGNVLAVNGNATSVSEVAGEDVEVEGIYDLVGRKLKQISSPGVYIVNGKKTFVK